MPEKTTWRGVMRDHPSQTRNRNQERNLDSSPDLTEMRQQEKKERKATEKHHLTYGEEILEWHNCHKKLLKPEESDTPFFKG